MQYPIWLCCDLSRVFQSSQFRVQDSQFHEFSTLLIKGNGYEAKICAFLYVVVHFFWLWLTLNVCSQFVSSMMPCLVNDEVGNEAIRPSCNLQYFTFLSLAWIICDFCFLSGCVSLYVVLGKERGQYPDDYGVIFVYLCCYGRTTFQRKVSGL